MAVGKWEEGQLRIVDNEWFEKFLRGKTMKLFAQTSGLL